MTIRLALVGGIPAVAALALGCGDGGVRAAEVPAVTLAMRGAAAATVDTATIEAALGLPAQLYVEHDAVVVARAAGVVDSLFADLGSAVTRGQPLAVLERADQEIAWARADEAYDIATKVVTRARKMTGFGGMTAADSEQAEFAWRDAAIARRRAERDLVLTRVLAPFDGQVTLRAARPQRYVAVGETLFRVTGRGPLLARVRVPEVAAATLRPGEPAAVIGATGASAGRVERIAPALDPGSATREVIVRLTSGTRLLPGANVTVRLGRERRRAIVAPAAAVGADGWALVLDQDGRGSLRAVTVGETLPDGRVEILAGLAPGERVSPRER